MPGVASSNNTHWFIFHDGKLLISATISQQPLSSIDIEPLAAAFTHQYCLLNQSNCVVHCAELPLDHAIPDTFVTIPLRKALEQLDHDWYPIAVKAASIINWDKNHQFCGRCGSQTIHQGASFERSCPDCSLLFYPRISPSVIVAIQKDDHILMARSPHFTPGAYGLIAGFVEPGESLESAVHREVLEEVDIKITNLQYYGSQSWPFPDSIMMGFTADYASGEIQIDNHEISEAGWYRYDQLPGRPSSKISISNRLLDHTIDELSKRYKI